MKYFLSLFLFSLLFSTNSLADITTYCNWSVILNPKQPEYSSLRNTSPAGCISGKFILDPERAVPLKCPEGYSQYGTIQGGIVGAIGNKFYLLEARRLCLKP